MTGRVVVRLPHPLNWGSENSVVGRIDRYSLKGRAFRIAGKRTITQSC